jgi:uncharacterized protein (TIGR03437 family)
MLIGTDEIFLSVSHFFLSMILRLGKGKSVFALCLVYAVAAWAGEITYSVQTVAGSSLVGDGGSALNAQLSDAQCLVVDRLGNVYIADPANHRVRKVNLAGVIQTVAGVGFAGFSGDGGPAVQSHLNAPYGLATDPAGNLYIADLGNNRLRKVSPDGVISTVAGTGQPASGGDGGKASLAQLNGPRNVVVDSGGSLYIAEFLGHRVRQVTPDGLIRTIAGTGSAGARGEGIAATLAELAFPAGMFLDFTGTLYIADSGNQRIRTVFNGLIRTLPLAGAQLALPTGIASDSAGGIYIADGGNHRLFRRMFGGAVIPVAGGVTLDSAREVVTDGFGNLLIADGRRVRLLTGVGFATTFAGDGTFGFRGDGGPAGSAVLNGPAGVSIDGDGNLYVADQRNHRVRKVSASGIISTLVGTGQPANAAEGLAPTSTPLVAPEGLMADPAGALWIAEYFGNRVRKLAPGGTILTIAGNGTAGFSGDARPATSAQLQAPGQIALDPAGNLYIADSGNNRIRKVTAGIISTFAGTGSAGFSGDGGQAVSAQLTRPRGIALDNSGNLYIADTGNHRVRKVSPGGQITTVAGEGAFPLNLPRSVAVDPGQNLYIADTANHRIVMRSASGTLSVIAGLGAAGYGGDGGDALSAQFSSPAAIAVDLKGNLYVADLDNNLVRKLTPSTPVIFPAPVTQLPAVRFLHAATLLEGPVAPGQLLSIFAEGIGPVTPVSGTFGAGGILDILLSETQVLFDGRAAPLIEVRQSQIQVQVPYEVAGLAATHVEVFHAGTRKVDATLAVESSVPGIFTLAGSTGAARVSNQDGSANSRANPADPGSVITLFATGAGQTIPPGIDGKRSAEPYPEPAEAIVVWMGGRPAEVLFAAEAPGAVGIVQIGARVPAIVAEGAVPLALSIGSSISQEGVMVFVR